MKIKMYSFSYLKGGAAIAAKKFSDLLSRNGYDVDRISQDDAGLAYFLPRLISHLFSFMQSRTDPVKHSLNLFSYAKVLEGMSNTQAIHHIHWINNDTLSVFSFNKIPDNSVISLHDEWLYCGTEHYCQFIPSLNHSDVIPPFTSGYSGGYISSKGINWKRIVWEKKCKHLSSRNDIIYTVPSRWMYERAKNSFILSSKDIRILPNPIDTKIFSPSDGLVYRKRLSISSSNIVVTFGAIDGRSNPVKGAKLLEEAISLLPMYLPKEISDRVVLVVFGGDVKSSYNFPFKTFNLGRISEQHILAQLYAASNCVVVPSYVESFGQVAAEAQSCGTPVIAFATSGLNDIIVDGETGFLAKPFSVESLAKSVCKLLLLSSEESDIISSNARLHIVENYSYEVVGKKYLDIINEVALRK